MGFFEQLSNIAPQVRILKDEAMKNHTTFRVGGPADYLVYVSNAAELKAVFEAGKSENLDIFVLGNGSNLLVSDEGFRGVVVAFERPEHPIHIIDKTENGETIEIPAGAMLSAAARAVASEGLKGFEFAAGIPGTLGGAVVMNAGAYGGEIKDSLVSALVLESDGSLRERTAEELELSYRHSVLQTEGGVVISATFSFEYGNPEEIQGKIEELAAKRREKQPLEYPSAGSTFKRPEGYFAGKLIEEAGLKGHQIGGAQVSEKHCGFIINRENATAADIKYLIDYVIMRVADGFGVTLEPEVRFLGF